MNMIRNNFLTTVIFCCIAIYSTSIFAVEPRVEDVSFVAKVDKSKQHYVLIFPKDFDPKQSRDMLIALHGHGADRWQFVREKDGEFKVCRDVAAERKMLYVSPDYRARTSWMGPNAEADLLQIIDELREKYAIERIFICGGSMGGTSSISFAALHPKLISGVVAMNGTANLFDMKKFEDAMAKSFGGTKAEIPEVYKARSAEYWPERLTMPVAFTTGGKDDIVPPESATRLYDVLKVLKRPALLVHQATGGHFTTYEDGEKAFKFVFENAKPFVAKESDTSSK
jgi:pimeloyl-ACP methyl ester carboxylesterase